MALHVIPLTPARNLAANGRIILPIRSDITDYGTPGHHLHPPLAKRAKSFLQRAVSKDEAEGDPIELEPILGEGQAYTFTQNVALTAINANVSQRINYPFVITQIMWRNPGTGPTVGNDLKVRVSESPDVAGGFSASGIDVAIRAAGGASGEGTVTFNDFQHGNEIFSVWPFFIWRQPFGFIKVIIRNLDGGTTVHVVVIARRLLNP